MATITLDDVVVEQMKTNETFGATYRQDKGHDRTARSRSNWS